MNQEIKARKPVRRVGRKRPAPIHPAPVVLPGRVAAEHGQKHVAEMKNNREKEKIEMKALNIKLTTVLTKIRYLEAENKHLKNNLSAQNEFKYDKIKILYEDRLDELKALLKDKDEELAAVKSKNESLEEEVDDLSEQLSQVQDEKDRVQSDNDGLHDDVARYIADSETSRRRASELQKQLEDWKARNGIVVNQMNALREELKNETTQRLELANCTVKLEDELSFNYDIHDVEVKELQAMISKLKKIPDFDETWKAEIGNIVADLSAQYEDQMRKTIAAMESKHALELQLMKANAKPREDVIAKRRDLRKEEGNKLGKIRDLETQIANLKSKINELESKLDEAVNGRESDAASYEAEIERLRRELEEILTIFQDLANDKNFLGMNIAACQALFEAENSSERSKSVEPHNDGSQTEDKETMDRRTSGSVKVVEVATDGKYIKLEDHAKFPKGATSIKNWILTQTLDNGKSHTHKFTNGNVFASNKIVKIWGSKHGAGQDGITSSDVTEWDTSTSTISLKDTENMEIDVLVIK